jgi:hypothetical protein
LFVCSARRGSSELRIISDYSFGLPDLLIFCRCCFWVALRTFLVPRVFFLFFSFSLAMTIYFSFAAPLDVLPMRSLVGLNIGEPWFPLLAEAWNESVDLVPRRLAAARSAPLVETIHCGQRSNHGAALNRRESDYHVMLKFVRSDLAAPGYFVLDRCNPAFRTARWRV